MEKNIHKEPNIAHKKPSHPHQEPKTIIHSTQKVLFNKLIIIGGLCLIFAIGLGMLGSLVYERQDNAQTIKQEISNQHVKSQELTTPFITASIMQTLCDIDTSSKSIKNKGASASISCKNNNHHLPLFASNTQSQQKLQVTDGKYKRGIYSVTSYQGSITYTQHYDFSDFVQELQTTQKSIDASNTLLNSKKNSEGITASEQSTMSSNIRLLLPISDLRGVIEMPKVTIGNQEFVARYPDNDVLTDLDFLEVIIPNTAINKRKNLDLGIAFTVAGIQKMTNIPLGEQFQLAMRSNWQTPNFIGDALPIDRDIGDNGFFAKWQNQHLAITNSRALVNCIIEDGRYCAGRMSSFETEFAQPNDVYLQTERSLKYGLLLLVISFGSFFLFEVVKSLKIHPMQYLLVSMALLVFYVLLLSLAEQMSFWQAYAIAATACAGLIGWYASFVLRSVVRAGLFTLLLIGQYAGFFTILTIENLNLVIGAILCFVLIAVVMFITRNIDWYDV